MAKEIQVVSELAVQLHSREAEIVALPLPPVDPKTPVNPVTEIWHLSAVGETRLVEAEPQAAAMKRMNARHVAQVKDGSSRRATRDAQERER